MIKHTPLKIVLMAAISARATSSALLECDTETPCNDDQVCQDGKCRDEDDTTLIIILAVVLPLVTICLCWRCLGPLFLWCCGERSVETPESDQEKGTKSAQMCFELPNPPQAVYQTEHPQLSTVANGVGMITVPLELAVVVENRSATSETSSAAAPRR